MAPRSVRFGMRSRKLSNVGGPLGDQKFTISSSSVLPVFAVFSSYKSALGLRCGLWPSLCVIHKEDLCPSSGSLWITQVH
jgi:hypothetical protein